MTLQSGNYIVSADVETADVLIVNTCGFLDAAKEESIEVLDELAAYKRDDQLLIAAGCLAQRNGHEILERVPLVDGLLGTRRWMDVMELIHAIRGFHTHSRYNHPLKNGSMIHDDQGRELQRYSLLGEPDRLFDGPVPRPPVTGGSAYLKISDGCNAPCAFCTIPSFKGKLRSRSLEAVVDEADALVRSGAKELVVVAQDTTDYGRDRGEPNSLPQLLSAICNRTSDNLRWVRLMYAYPGHVSPELIEVMATQPKIVPYLDMPLQHADAAVLRRMRRPSRLETVYEHIDQLRSAMPDIALRTTFIVGYPGETEAEFDELLAFIDAVQFDKVGAFTFSPEPGTPSALVPDRIPEVVQEERYNQLMEMQQAISLRRNQIQVGKKLEILIEGQGELHQEDREERLDTTLKSGIHPEPLLLGRSYRDAPEVDGLVLVPGIRGVPVGEMIEVVINGAMEYDLVGEPLIEKVYTSKFRQK